MWRIKILEWEKVSLVVPEKQDVNLWYEGMNNLEIWKNLVYTFWKIWHLEDEEEYYEFQRKSKVDRMFSIYENETKDIIWNIRLSKINDLSRNAEFWITIFKENKLWKWLWTDAIKLLLKFAFEIIWLHKVYGRYVVFNERAWKAYEKVWFKKVWVLKDQEFLMWKYYDQILIEIFRDDFLKDNKK